MKRFDFDTPVNRKGTCCEKWDEQGGDFIPLWVADMDFKSPEPILEAVKNRMDHGVFGYTEYDWELTDTIVDYYKKYYGCEIDPEWIVWVPSVMPGANIACRCAGGKIMYNTPMYPHIRRLPEEAHCPYQEIPLCKKDGIYTFDMEAMEAELERDVKAFVLCNPHNPVGRVFTKEELEEIVEFCEKHDLLLISDEIHSQLIFEGTHIPAFMISEKAKMRSITLTSAAKTYNIPAIPFAFAIIPDEEIRKRYKDIAKGLFATPDALTAKAVKAAYTQCDDWREALIHYLKENRDYLEERISGIPGLKVNHNEATYLSWIDATGLNVDNPWEFFRKEAGVNFSNGEDFGYPGYLRLNFGCTKALLKEALDKVEGAVKSCQVRTQ